MLENIFRSFCVLVFKTLGWRAGNRPNVPKAIILVAGHTSNFDFVLGMGFATIRKIKAKYTIKKEWITFPFKGMLLNSGAIGIDRNKETNKLNYIEIMTDLFKKNDTMFLCITPEATRSANKKWKTGFYRLAKAANVPIILTGIDYKTKTINCSHQISAGETFEDTMREIKSFHSNIQAKYPDKFVFPDL